MEFQLLHRSILKNIAESHPLFFNAKLPGFPSRCFRVFSVKFNEIYRNFTAPRFFEEPVKTSSIFEDICKNLQISRDCLPNRARKSIPPTRPPPPAGISTAPKTSWVQFQWNCAWPWVALSSWKDDSDPLMLMRWSSISKCCFMTSRIHNFSIQLLAFADHPHWLPDVRRVLSLRFAKERQPSARTPSNSVR